MQHARMPQAEGLAPGQVQVELDRKQQRCMVRALRRMLRARDGRTVALIETHISFVLVCADRAYKLKKVLHTPFLDQSTMRLRQWACQEELRLNRRLAPELYLAAVPITGTPAAPGLGGEGLPIDFAVQMRAFAQEGLWDRLAARERLGATHVDELVQQIARFHAGVAVATPGGRLGSPAQVRAPLLQSLHELEGLVDGCDGRAMLVTLRAWEAVAFGRLRALMALRLARGQVRECHGDLHLGNVAVIDGHSTVFDGIEFNDDFRWIDVMSEVAFMAMDLHAHGLPHLAHRFINAYLERSGDYAGVPLLDYYLVHRALVRAKAHGLRATQLATACAAQGAERAAASRYLELALRFSRRRQTAAVLMVTHGFSGSGKSTLTQGLLEAIGAVRIRADVERKRLAGLQSLDRPSAQQAVSLYGPRMMAATYARIGRLAAPALRSGYPVILDATFLRRAQRQAAQQRAARQGAASILLDFTADAAELAKRLRARSTRGDDASDADETVLAQQMQTAEPLQADEAWRVFQCPQASTAAGSAVADASPLLQWLASRACSDQASD